MVGSPPPTRELPVDMGGIMIQSVDGREVSLPSLWSGRVVILVLLPCYNSRAARQYVQTLLKEVVPKLSSDVALALVGSGTLDGTKQFQQRCGWSGELYCDPSLESYRGLSLIYDPSVGGFGRCIQVGCFSTSTTQGHAKQLGGTFIIGPHDHQIRMAHRDKTLDGQPPTGKILRAAGLGAESVVAVGSPSDSRA
eukprot:GFYU01024087.1.p1 GENE.GFYU01024087.1~~GFYU01024087.1.p1  ORF type:complete len:195 (-),score=28.17 GFYU01024087.1:156-740(-)